MGATKITLADKVRILRDHGIQVNQWFDAREQEPPPVPQIVFSGDELEGFRAVKALQAEGVPIGSLRREWFYAGREEYAQITWMLSA